MFLLTKRISSFFIGLALLIGVAVSGVLFISNQKSGPAPAAAANECQFFAETGFQVCGRFLDFWRKSGGLAQQGFPVSEEFEELNSPPPQGDGKVHKVQYFQRARFEEHLENLPPNDVLLGLLGAEQYRTKYKSAEFMVLRTKRFESKIANWTPKAGHRFLVVDLLITNNTPKKVTISPASITVRSAKVYDYKVADATYSSNRYLRLSDLFPGENVGGDLVFEIPINDDPVAITIDYFVGKASVRF